MTEPSVTAVRLAGEDFLRPSLARNVKRMLVQLFLRKPTTEILALVLDPRATLVKPLGVLSGDDFKKQVEGTSASHVVVVRENHLRHLIEALPAMLAETAELKRYAMLVPHRTPPPPKRRPGRDVHGLICDPQTFCSLPRGSFRKPKSLPYHAAMFGIETTDPEFTLLCRQAPYSAAPAPRMPAGRSIRVIIPHRGDLGHLRNCLRRTLLALRGVDGRVNVALDEDPRDEHLALVREFPTVKFWRVEPNGGGPYVPRHILGMSAQETYVAFQDSDDVPTRDRFSKLLIEAEGQNADVVGSHVIDLHEDRDRAKAMRYPVDAVSPLETKPQNTVFHPTTIVRSNALRTANGFSTIRRMASDREFNLRSFFLQQSLRNTDEFLYVRRMRADSLIHSPETGMKSQARKELHVMWHADWVRILNRELTLEESTIRARHLEPMPRLVPVESAVAAQRDA
jgi:hypothetical protein